MLNKRISTKYLLAIFVLVCLLATNAAPMVETPQADDPRIDWILDMEVQLGDTVSFWGDQMMLYSASFIYSDPYDPNISPMVSEIAVDLKRLKCWDQAWMQKGRPSKRFRNEVPYTGLSLNGALKNRASGMRLLSVSTDEDTLRNMLGSSSFIKCRSILGEDSGRWLESTPFCLHCYYSDSILYSFARNIVPADWMTEPTCDVLKRNLADERATFNRSYCLVKEMEGSFYLFHVRYFAAVYESSENGGQAYPSTFHPEVLSIYRLNQQMACWTHLQDIPVRTDEQVRMKEKMELAPSLVETQDGGYCIIFPTPFDHHLSVGTNYYFLFSDMKPSFGDSTLEGPRVFKPFQLR